ncbi:type I methionyl aminopeptidase [Candidatus Magnetominusculus dajiuhuensis]|uniref:type I methionyl aminopeptidase n=1 Tax=Candidatus Magnetominusculus dajiuhuensis TaxID=3137712 RepID=UPI003B434D53
MIIIKSDEEISKIGRASKIVAETLMRLGEVIVPGITTRDIEIRAEDIIKSNKATSAFKGYRGYPANLCISVNNEVIHGIPSRKRVLKDGDIVSLDVGVIYDGYIGDGAWTYPVGKVSRETMRLLAVTRESLYKGIEKARANNRVSDISHSIQTHVEGCGYSVVRAFVGHGVGRSLHEEPQIPNYGLPNKGPRLKKGMVLAIEPMVNAGGYEVAVLKDGWTAVTVDGSMSAHFEHTVVITEDEAGILTQLN